MSNYIVVSNGLLKREKPNTLPIVEFKNYKYLGCTRHNVEKKEVLEEAIINPIHDVPQITVEQIIEDLNVVFGNRSREDEARGNTPHDRWMRSEITDIEYLDIISERDEHV